MTTLIKQLNEQLKDTSKELRRIADHHFKNRSKMTDDQLRDAIGDDLEQLEYTPAQIKKFVPVVLGMVKTD